MQMPSRENAMVGRGAERGATRCVSHEQVLLTPEARRVKKDLTLPQRVQGPATP